MKIFKILILLLLYYFSIKLGYVYIIYIYIRKCSNNKHQTKKEEALDIFVRIYIYINCNIRRKTLFIRKPKQIKNANIKSLNLIFNYIQFVKKRTYTKFQNVFKSNDFTRRELTLNCGKLHLKAEI